MHGHLVGGIKRKERKKKEKRKAGLLKTKEHGHKEKAGGVKEQEDAGAEESERWLISYASLGSAGM